MSFSRVEKGLAIARNGGVKRVRERIERFEVTDFGGSQRTHIVKHNLDTDEWTCDCEDFKYRQNTLEECKHIWGAMIDERGGD